MIESPVLAPDTVRRAVLPNGMTVLIRRDASAPVVAIVTYVLAGYFDEPDEVVGIAHVLEHMYFKGTEARGVGEISRETKAAGGYLNAGTIYDHTSYYTVLPAASFVQGLEIQADAYAGSVIDANELRRELEVIIQEAKRKADNPGAVTVETLYEVLHDRHRIRRWRIGREPGLRRLTRTDLLAFYRNFYRPHNTILAVVGDVDPDEALEQVARIHGGIDDAELVRERGPAEPERAGFRYRELAGDIALTHLALGWRTPGSAHADSPLLDLAATVLGSGRASRLYRAVRERKLAASIGASNYTPTELGVFTVHAEGPPATAAQAARAAWEQVRDLREDGVEEDELVRARRLFESRWIRQLETMEGQANYLVEWEALGSWELGDAYLKRVLDATADEVNAAVRRWLAPDRCAVVVYRPTTAPPLAADADAMRRLLDAPPRPEPLPPAPSPPARDGRARARATLEREAGSVRVYRTGAGVPILVRQKPGAPLVHLGVSVAGGASDEPEEYAGLTSLLARTAIKGTERRSAAQIAEEAELLGGSVGASSASESFGWSISVPRGNALEALELLADVAQHAAIPEDALATERAIAIADLEQLRDDMYRYPMRLATQAAFAGHPYGIPASGFESSLARVDAARVRAWHRERVLDGPAVIAIVGDVDADDAAAAAAAQFHELRGGELAILPQPTWPAEAVVLHESREKAQTALALAFPAPDRRSAERWAAHLIAGVASGLGGRFFEELRDRRSLAYTVAAFTSERRLAGMFVAYIATSPEQEAQAREGLLAEFARLREEPVTERELSQAKAYAIGTHAIRQQSGGALLGDVLDAWTFGTLAELEEHDERVRSVTAAEMRDLARTWFEAGRVVEGVVRGTGKAV